MGSNSGCLLGKNDVHTNTTLLGNMNVTSPLSATSRAGETDIGGHNPLHCKHHLLKYHTSLYHICYLLKNKKLHVNHSQNINMTTLMYMQNVHLINYNIEHSFSSKQIICTHFRSRHTFSSHICVAYMLMACNRKKYCSQLLGHLFIVKVYNWIYGFVFLAW